jgi:hypothetical protein
MSPEPRFATTTLLQRVGILAPHAPTVKPITTGDNSNKSPRIVTLLELQNDTCFYLILNENK